MLLYSLQAPFVASSTSSSTPLAGPSLSGVPHYLQPSPQPPRGSSTPPSCPAISCSSGVFSAGEEEQGSFKASASTCWMPLQGNLIRGAFSPFRRLHSHLKKAIITKPRTARNPFKQKFDFDIIESNSHPLTNHIHVDLSRSVSFFLFF